MKKDTEKVNPWDSTKEYKSFPIPENASDIDEEKIKFINNFNIFMTNCANDGVSETQFVDGLLFALVKIYRDIPDLNIEEKIPMLHNDIDEMNNSTFRKIDRNE